MEKHDEAKQVYDEAVKAGKSAGLVDTRSAFRIDPTVP